MSFTLHGIPVSRGIAIGRAYLLAPATLDVPHYLLDPSQIDDEIARFHSAQATVQHELDTLKAANEVPLAIDGDYVTQRVGQLSKNADLSRFIL